MRVNQSDAPGVPPPLPGAVFAGRRERLLKRLGDAVALIPAASEHSPPGSTESRYNQNSDFEYLTGFPEPGALAVLTPHDDERRFTLFVQARDADQEAWSGSRAGPEGAREVYGADAAYPIDQLDGLLPDLVKPASRIVLPLGVDPDLDCRAVAMIVSDRGGRQRSGRGPVGVDDLAPLLGPMRRIKRAEEIARIRVAASIAMLGHRAAMAAAGVGVGEWEIEAAIEGTFRQLGAAGPAFPTIVGSGANGIVLHYTANDRVVGEGDLVLVDAGARWGGYCSDITRTFPASGRFTAPQREIYDIVLAAERAGIAAAAPGAPVSAIHDAAVGELARGLLRLRLVEGADAQEVIAEGRFRRFYMHQTAHWLGLEVHDSGGYRDDGEPIMLQPGMVLTVEPGLYIPAADDIQERYRGIGIRIEDDVLITGTGNEVLTRELPTDAEAVETMSRSRMASKLSQ